MKSLVTFLTIFIFGNNLFMILLNIKLCDNASQPKNEFFCPLSIEQSIFNYNIFFLGIGSLIIYFLERKSPFSGKKIQNSKLWCYAGIIFFCIAFLNQFLSLVILQASGIGATAFIFVPYMASYSFFSLLGVRNFVIALNSNYKKGRSFCIMLFLLLSPIAAIYTKQW